MENLIIPIVLGIVEGITEFLPVSSTGHLIIANQWFQLEDSFRKMFDVVIQLGAILSVIVMYRHRIIPSPKGRGSLKNREIIQLWGKTAAGVVPALAAGAVFGDVVKAYLFNPVTVAVALIAGGLVLIAIERKDRPGIINSTSELRLRDAVVIGLFQCLALIPGTSRSAATIIGAMAIGTSRKVAAEFSFFLAIPTMFAASAYSLMDFGFKLTATQWQILATGFIVSFFVAWAVIAVFIDYVSKRDFKVFGYYRVVLGVLILLFFK